MSLYIIGMFFCIGWSINDDAQNQPHGFIEYIMYAISLLIWPIVLGYAMARHLNPKKDDE